MRDFRAFTGSDSPPPSGPAVGGSAFSLPSLPIVGSLGLASLALLLRPWHLMRVLPFRRGGITGGFFSWGRLATIVLAAMLLLSPSTLQHAFPEWRNLAVVCFFVSAISVLGAISRCCGSALSCAFWVALTLFMGEKAFKPGQMTGMLDSFRMPQLMAAAEPQIEAPVLLEHDEWEDMVTGEPVSARTVSYAAAPRSRRAADHPDRVTPRRYEQPPARVAEQGILSGFSASLSNGVGSMIPQSDFLGTTLSSSSGWRDGAALPESAYFGGGAKVGAVGQAFQGGGGEGIGGGVDQIIEQVGGFLQR